MTVTGSNEACTSFYLLRWKDVSFGGDFLDSSPPFSPCEDLTEVLRNPELQKRLLPVRLKHTSGLFLPVNSALSDLLSVFISSSLMWRAFTKVSPSAPLAPSMAPGRVSARCFGNGRVYRLE